MKGLNLYLVGSLENQFDVHLGLASSMTNQKSCVYTGEVKGGRGNHAVTKAMYFTQEKNKFESLHIIVTLIALFMHQIAHWSGYQILRTGGIILHTFFMYQISSLNNESYCCGIEWSESLYCCGFCMLSIVLLVEKIPVNFLAVTMNQY